MVKRALVRREHAVDGRKGLCGVTPAILPVGIGICLIESSSERPSQEQDTGRIAGGTLEAESLKDGIHEGARAFFIAEGLAGDADFYCAGGELGGDY